MKRGILNFSARTLRWVFLFFLIANAAPAAVLSALEPSQEDGFGNFAENISESLSITAETLRIREALGEIDSAGRTQEMKKAVERCRASVCEDVPVLRQKRYQAVQQLITRTQAQLDSAKWPADHSAAEYRELARLTLNQAQLQVAGLEAVELDMADALRPVAEALGWTQGVKDRGRVFDGLDEEIEAAIKEVFAGLRTAPQLAAAAKLPPGRAGAFGSNDIIDAGREKIVDTFSAGAAPSPTYPVPQADPSFSAPPAAGNSGFEYQVDRPGSDYSSFDIPTIYLDESAQKCDAACRREGKCRAWTLINSGLLKPTARCWLKDNVPMPVRATLAISGVVRPLGASPISAAPAMPSAAPRNPLFEYDTDRQGSDYLSFDLPVENPELCFARCRDDNQCQAWTYVKPGVQGPSARCWLKKQTPNPAPHNCCISGTFTRVIDRRV